jgi:hypothetical protein
VSRDATGLRDEIALLRRSLDDARAEHTSGDLDDEGLRAIERRDGAQLNDALDRLAELEPQAVDGRAAAPDHPRRPRRRSRALLVTTLACVAIIAGVVTLAVVQPFASTLHLSARARVQVFLLAAEFEVAHDQTLRALTLYDAVLKLAPRNPEALAESGWLRYEYALGQHDAAGVAAGEAQLRRTIVIAPREAAGHLYYAIVLLQQHHDRAGALAQLDVAASLPESPVEQSLTAEFLGLVQPRS